MIPAYDKKECAAFHSRRESGTGESPNSFPEENTTMPYSGFEAGPTRLQAEGHIILAGENRFSRKDFPSGKKQNQENTRYLRGAVSHFSVLLDCRTVSTEEFVAVNDVIVCTTPIGAEERHFGACSKNIIGTIDSDGENEINNAAPVPSSSEM
ncbi:hypothetical protein TNCV_2557451 [Trichonephila clavipes]|nr:hypothetical protein TNCV_2557451 [Trichonephila clavipes]